MAVATKRYREWKENPYRLGRHMELDSRSLAYVAEEQVTAPVPIRPEEYPAPIPTLDQGQLGSCTGNAGTRALAWLYRIDLSEAKLGELTLTGDPDNDERFAVELYHRATMKDSFPGIFPPNDSGSSGLGICKALKAAGLVSSYHWIVSENGLCQALQRGPVIIGMPWYKAFFDPDNDGFIDANTNWESSGRAGGHELYIEALESYDPAAPEEAVVRIHNSWKDSWGDHGCGRMRLKTYTALKKEIDLKQLSKAA